MAKILQPVLKALDRLYRFESAQTQPETFDVATSVQPVHDVSGEAEREFARLTIPPGVTGGAKRDGTWAFGIEHAFVAPGDFLAGFQLSPGNLATYGLDLSVVDLRLIGCQASMDAAGAVDSIEFYIDPQGKAGNLGTFSDPWLMVERMATWAAGVTGGVAAEHGIPTRWPQDPGVKVTTNDVIYAAILATGAVTVVVSFWFEIETR